MIFEMPACGGCRTCEMACSFHHTGEFNPTVSSIKIVEREGQDGFYVHLWEKPDGPALVCDGCKKLNVPLCTQYCCESDALAEILGQYIKKACD
jgi:Fe-S-cluster-containing dehydrogenase component